ncbi:MAG: LytTR family transcriptional regulator [Desulfomonile tiedjei]|nr:LytTR family transcriptional regulator [Desulfomonile tiedjei]
MKDVWNTLNIGQVLLSRDFNVVGINDYARQVFGPILRNLGESLFRCHSRKSRERVAALLQELTSAPSDMPRTMVLDVLGKVVMFNLSQLSVASPRPQSFWSVTLIDISEQTGAAKNPLSGALEMKRFPVYKEGICHFLPTDAVHSIQSDGDYCKIFTPGKSYYLHSSLKNLLQRFTGASFFRVHKGFIVNLDHVSKLTRDGKGHTLIIFDDASIPPVPVSRRRLAEVRKAVHLL